MPRFPDGWRRNPTVAVAATAKTRGARRRFMCSFGLSLLLVTLLIAMNVAVLAPHTGLADRVLGRPHYYVALGDSISFGFQPTLNFTHGYADDIFAGLRQDNVTHLVNFACLGETSASMLQGSCPYHNILKEAYSGAQLNAAVAFLTAHRGQVNPVTISIGGNDVAPNTVTCAIAPTTQSALAAMDDHLTTPGIGILPRLAAALEVAPGERVGDLVLLNYYNPYAAACPNTVEFIHQLNDHLARDAAQLRIPVADVYDAFGGDTGMAGAVCRLTWFCDTRFDHDIHPTSAGYQRIAAAVEGVLGYARSSPTRSPTLGPTTGALGAAPTPETRRIRSDDSAAQGQRLLRQRTRHSLTLTPEGSVQAVVCATRGHQTTFYPELDARPGTRRTS